MRIHFLCTDGWHGGLGGYGGQAGSGWWMESRAIAGSMGSAAEMRERERAGERVRVRFWRNASGLSVCVACAPVRGAGAPRDGMPPAGVAQGREPRELAEKGCREGGSVRFILWL